MTVSLGSSLASEGFFLFVDLWEAQPCLRDPEWDSWITLWWMINVYWLDLTLACIFDHAVCCASAASSGRSLNLITSQLRMKQSSSNCPNHVRQTKSSIKKWIIVRWTVWSMFGKQKFAQLRTGFRLPAHPSDCQHTPQTASTPLRLPAHPLDCQYTPQTASTPLRLPAHPSDCQHTPQTACTSLRLPAHPLEQY